MWGYPVLLFVFAAVASFLVQGLPPLETNSWQKKMSITAPAEWHLCKCQKNAGTPLDASTCTSCKKPVNEENSVVLVRCPKKIPLARRCKACHTLKSRINHVMTKHGNLAQDWTKVTEEQKREFYKKYREPMGEDLMARMQETVTESKRISSSVEFQGAGDYLDEVRQVWLYEDVKYKRTAKDSEEVSRTDKRKRQGIPTDQCQDANADASGSGGSKN